MIDFCIEEASSEKCRREAGVPLLWLKDICRPASVLSVLYYIWGISCPITFACIEIPVDFVFLLFSRLYYGNFFLLCRWRLIYFVICSSTFFFLFPITVAMNPIDINHCKKFSLFGVFHTDSFKDKLGLPEFYARRYFAVNWLSGSYNSERVYRENETRNIAEELWAECKSASDRWARGVQYSWMRAISICCQQLSGAYYCMYEIWHDQTKEIFLQFFWRGRLPVTTLHGVRVLLLVLSNCQDTEKKPPLVIALAPIKAWPWLCTLDLLSRDISRNEMSVIQNKLCSRLVGVTAQQCKTV